MKVSDIVAPALLFPQSIGWGGLMKRELFQGNELKALAAIPLWLAMIFADGNMVRAALTPCDQDENCVRHAAPPPDFGNDPQHPYRGGGGTWPIFSLGDQEPYRNSDMGPLGVVLSTGE